VVVGSNGQWETEGADRHDLKLLGEQDELIRRVLEANPRTAVVINAGAPVQTPWADAAAAVVMLWYPGEEGAPALADIVTGAAEPGGRLPITFPARLEDSATHAWYPGSEGKVVYGEGVLVGYRHFDANHIEPAFCFGHGLSYTTFAYDEPTVEVEGPHVTVTVPVTNTGARRGSEVVQLYVSDLEATVSRPERELKAFAKVKLDSGETASVRLELDQRSFAFWDEISDDWVVEPGEFDLHLGSSSRDLRRRVRIER
jgi:beta-glucosidase